MYSYYRPQYRSTRRSAPVKQPQMATVLGADVMWGVAAWADRVNGGYVRETQRDENTGTVTSESNRDLIRQEVQSGLTRVTPDDMQQGQQARTWHKARLMFKVLRGQTLSDFERTLNDVVQQEEFNNRTDALAVAVVASQIASYRKGLAEEALMETVDRSPLAAVGAKVSVEATVVRSVFSLNYNVTFITARTQCNRLVFFSYREGMDAGTMIHVRGTVKAHRPDSTQLTRVKLG